MWREMKWSRGINELRESEVTAEKHGGQILVLVKYPALVSDASWEAEER